MPAESSKDLHDSPTSVSSAQEGSSPVEDFTPGDASSQDLRDELVRTLQEEKKRLSDELLRKQAEIENVRKRMEREKQEFQQYALLSAMKELLPVLDGFERALESGGSGEEYRKGVALIHQQFSGALKKLGLNPMESKGREFDPRLHEAVATIETDDLPEHQIVEEMQRGYMFRDRLVRPAMVKVSKHKS